MIESLDSAFERVVTDIRRSIDYYISQPDGMAVSRLLITGGATLLPGTVEFIEDRLGTPVEKVNPIDCSPVDLSNVVTEEIASSSLVVCGLAIPEGTEHYVSMSFVPESIRQRKEFEQKRSYIVIHAFFLVILVVISVMYMQKELLFRSQVYDDINAVLTIDKGKIGKELYQVRTQQEEMKKRFDMLGGIAARRGKIINNLMEIVEITPTNHVSITSINIEHDRMLIKGDATNDEGVKAFIQELRLSPYIQTMKNITKEGSGNSFTFDIQELHEPNEKEDLFYGALRPLRLRIPQLRNFRFGSNKFPRQVLFVFYEYADEEELCEEFSTVLEVLVNSQIEYQDVLYRVLNLKEEEVRRFSFKDESEVMRVYHGEISMCDYIREFEEAQQKKIQEQKKAKLSKQK